VLSPGLGKAGGSSFLHPGEDLASVVLARAKEMSGLKCMGIGFGDYG